jgi:hypothetical protein
MKVKPDTKSRFVIVMAGGRGFAVGGFGIAGGMAGKRGLKAGK